MAVAMASSIVADMKKYDTIVAKINKPSKGNGGLRGVGVLMIVSPPRYENVLSYLDASQYILALVTPFKKTFL